MSKKGKKSSKSKEKSILEKIQDFYINEYKKLFLIPVILFLIAVLLVFNTYRTTGDFIKRDVTLKGGISLTINTDYSNIDELEGLLNERFPDASVNLRVVESGGEVTGIIIEASDITVEELEGTVSEKIELTDYSVETMGSALGESFFRQMFVALLLAFFGMGIVFHLYFRNLYATFAALISAFFDIFITLGIMDIMDVRLTAGGIAAYLMLIGYSIDTSILLSTKLLKEQVPLREAIFGAMKTGFTMSAAGIAATGISFLLTNNITLKQIMLILIVGLVMDLFTTWLGNVGFLRIYLERKDVKG